MVKFHNPIGMRMVKSSLAVFICLIIGWLRAPVSLPFYSAIAAVLCMQKDVEQSKTVSVNRIIGTFIGGIYGTVVSILMNYLFTEMHIILQYLIISLAIIPLIYVTIKIDRPGSSYIGCVVFFCIVLVHSDGNQLSFAIERMIDTLIGIGTSLLVNINIHPQKITHAEEKAMEKIEQLEELEEPDEKDEAI